MEQKNILTSNGGQKVLNESQVDNLLVIFTYTFKEFLYWWYIRMPLWHLRMLSRISTFVDDNFSMSLLLKNFFIPWHRDFSFIGYTFGIIIKIIYLPIAIFAYIFICSLYLLVILVWLLLPPATILFILRSILSI
ncbi:hypothetical protein CVU76_02955 [Candidatus Dojkabacteria bacterium HGW-Dojkabacteria-1]|uniref:Uncharacterized protein n=1 Tax=Candidatus Dojkabacteria bacterium HGW-Dojkabacteria-1 TaxID=2013761 RepID=A0A2N2F453_9BACT|nr:MAG: hypothetical protein CVU76_02955 [Candidatus Dojkabacteria bacterium HGW-Dojkabacteria-1]